MIQKQTSTKDGKRDEVHIQLLTKNSLLVSQEQNLERPQPKPQFLVAVPPTVRESADRLYPLKINWPDYYPPRRSRKPRGF